MTSPGLLFSPLLASRGIPHAFTTRTGGVSAAPFDSLNFGNPMDLPLGQPRDPVSSIRENFRRVLDAIGLPGREVVQVYQVHGPRAHIFTPGSPSRDRRAIASSQPRDAAAPPVPACSTSTEQELDFKADALVTNDASRAVAVRVADCCPVLIASADGSVVAAVHAGWRGVVSDVVSAAVSAMATLLPRAAGTPLIAAIGPCIGPSHFEVGPEVAAEFTRRFGHAEHVRPHADPSAAALGKRFIDLQSALAELLRGAGVATIDTIAACTASDPARFFSHRRDKGVTGRMIGLIAPRAAT
ncbi:MAG: polyphenol oxidase family protein [Phycisphaerales bacterium]|nr:polyphenol oxidase family protein [Phycisphaerales bacterium]